MAADDRGVPSPTAAYKVHLPRAGILNTPCKVGQLGILTQRSSCQVERAETPYNMDIHDIRLRMLLADDLKRGKRSLLRRF
ncbi:MAG TPA: hypothetical protein VF772_09420 [Terriglobales bacterium]